MKLSILALGALATTASAGIFLPDDRNNRDNQFPPTMQYRTSHLPSAEQPHASDKPSPAWMAAHAAQSSPAMAQARPCHGHGHPRPYGHGHDQHNDVPTGTLGIALHSLRVWLSEHNLIHYRPFSPITYPRHGLGPGRPDKTYFPVTSAHGPKLMLKEINWRNVEFIDEDPEKPYSDAEMQEKLIALVKGGLSHGGLIPTMRAGVIRVVQLGEGYDTARQYYPGYEIRDGEEERRYTQYTGSYLSSEAEEVMRKQQEELRMRLEAQAKSGEGLGEADPDRAWRYREFPSSMSVEYMEEILQQREQEHGLLRGLRNVAPEDLARYGNHWTSPHVHFPPSRPDQHEPQPMLKEVNWVNVEFVDEDPEKPYSAEEIQDKVLAVVGTSTRDGRIPTMAAGSIRTVHVGANYMSTRVYEAGYQPKEGEEEGRYVQYNGDYRNPEAEEALRKQQEQIRAEMDKKRLELQAFRIANPDAYERYKEFPTSMGMPEMEGILSQREREGKAMRPMRGMPGWVPGDQAGQGGGMSAEEKERHAAGLKSFRKANPEVYERYKEFPTTMGSAEIEEILRQREKGAMRGQAGTAAWSQVPPVVVDLRGQMPAPAWTHAFAGHGDERPGGGLHGKNGWHHRRPQTFGGRLHRAMKNLRPAESLALAFVLGAGLGSIFHMLFMITLLLTRRIRCGRLSKEERRARRAERRARRGGGAVRLEGEDVICVLRAPEAVQEAQEVQEVEQAVEVSEVEGLPGYEEDAAIAAKLAQDKA